MSVTFRENIFEQINQERDYQDGKWGVGFDDKNTMNDWFTYIAIYGGRACEMARTKEEQRKFLLKTATLAVAALEAFDRNDGMAPRHYDSPEKE